MTFPEEIKEAISAIDDHVRWRIVELIKENESMAYTELLNRLEIQKGSLSHHLNRLMEGGILDNYSEDEFGGPYSSFYMLSQFGKDFTNSLLSSIEITSFSPLEENRHVSSPRVYKIEEAEVYPVKAYRNYKRAADILAETESTWTIDIEDKAKGHEQYLPFVINKETMRARITNYPTKWSRLRWPNRKS